MEVRPIEPHERPALEALGALLAHARRTAGVTQKQLALASKITIRHVQYLEAGREKRTRLSTLERIADFLAPMLQVDPEGLLDLFMETADVALGAETDFPEHDEHRRNARALRAFHEEMRTDRLGRVERKRSAPEAKRRAARATQRAMRRNLGLPMR
jgi:transcriptional regulator with XRE-family HTH domain